mmetsp:Transcript_21216/g.15536  ORF Transcript_21216/g.15536 Transcript_21216/m.15536 type:complete len:86 (+) Transcript_21216:260-517(+)
MLREIGFNQMEEVLRINRNSKNLFPETITFPPEFTEWVEFYINQNDLVEKGGERISDIFNFNEEEQGVNVLTIHQIEKYLPPSDF